MQTRAAIKRNPARHCRELLLKISIPTNVYDRLSKAESIDLTPLENASGLRLEAERQSIGKAALSYYIFRDNPLTGKYLRDHRKKARAADNLRKLLDPSLEEDSDLCAELEKRSAKEKKCCDGIIPMLGQRRGGRHSNWPLHLLIQDAAQIYRRAGGRGRGSYYSTNGDRLQYGGSLLGLIQEMLKLVGDNPSDSRLNTIGEQARKHMKKVSVRRIRKGSAST